MIFDVAGFGESSVDFVHVVSELPGPGVSKLEILSHYTTCGGQVANDLDIAVVHVACLPRVVGEFGQIDIVRRDADRFVH